MGIIKFLRKLAGVTETSAKSEPEQGQDHEHGPIYTEGRITRIGSDGKVLGEIVQDLGPVSKAITSSYEQARAINKALHETAGVKNDSAPVLTKTDNVQYFESPHVSVPGGMVQGGKAKVTWKPLPGVAAKIEAYKTGCYCTADVKWNEGEVTAIYTDDTKDSSFNMGMATITKSITLAFEDETGKIPLWTTNARGVKIFHPQRETTVISFEVRVRKKG